MARAPLTPVQNWDAQLLLLAQDVRVAFFEDRKSVV